MPCFYAPQLVPGMKNVTIEGDEYHHIVNVFRKKVDENLLLTNGRGLLAEARLDSLEKKSLTLKTISSRQFEKSLPKIAAGFSLLRNKNDQIIVEKLTELGVGKFFPFISQRTVRTVSGNTVEKFEKTAIAAVKQCDNPFLPEIRQVEKLTETIAILQNEEYTVLTALERNATELISGFLVEPIPQKIALLFGPEGGFTEQEIAFFEEKNIRSFTIGNHILRAETAAVAATSQLLLAILEKQPDYF